MGCSQRDYRTEQTRTVVEGIERIAKLFHHLRRFQPQTTHCCGPGRSVDQRNSDGQLTSSLVTLLIEKEGRSAIASPKLIVSCFIKASELDGQRPDQGLEARGT